LLLNGQAQHAEQVREKKREGFMPNLITPEALKQCLTHVFTEPLPQK